MTPHELRTENAKLKRQNSALKRNVTRRLAKLEKSIREIMREKV